MKRWIYFICFCTLMVLVCEELNKNRQDADPVAIETGSDQVVVTARLASQVKKENQRDRKIAYVTFDDGPSLQYRGDITDPAGKEGSGNLFPYQ